MTSAKIMVVEDESIIAKDLQNRLKKLGYLVTDVASSGEEAIHQAAENRPDLVLMDINLKGNMDGVEAARRIYAQYNIPIIYLTAYATNDILERARQTGASGYLLKPFKEKELHTNIEIAIAKHRTENSKARYKEKELEEIKSRFITTASHEFRTPLTIIATSAGLLEQYSHKLTQEKQRKHLERIQMSVEHITQLLEDALVINQAESGELKFQPLPLDLAQFCHNLVEKLQNSIDSNHQIVLQIGAQNSLSDADKNINTCMDKELLLQILTNLLSNAIKFSPPGKTVHFQLDFQDGAAIFQIKDQGIGIPREEQQKVFDTFYRANNVGHIPGVGLGLSVVKKCVDLHKGKITVASELGVGTTLTVRIPLS